MKIRQTPISAFSLIEVALALGIASFSLVTIFGLLPIGISNSQNAVEQTTAAGIATSISADLRATLLSSGSTSPLFGITVPTPGQAPTSATVYLAASGFPTGSVASSRYRASVSFAPPASGQKAATQVRIYITWPAGAAVGNAAGSFETLTALGNN